MEGVTSVIAGAMGCGGGATTLTDNIHIAAVTRMGSRMTVVVTAVLLIVGSLFGELGEGDGRTLGTDRNHTDGQHPHCNSHVHVVENDSGGDCRAANSGVTPW